MNESTPQEDTVQRILENKEVIQMVPDEVEKINAMY